MRLPRIPSLVLSLLLQAMPLLRVASADAALAVSPVMAIIRFLAGATAVAGSFHAVSGASITINSPAGGNVRATNGIPSPFRIELTYNDGGTLLKPAVYEAFNLPPGFNQPTKSGSIWRITGTPTQAGVFSNVEVTGYQNSSRLGNQATIVLTITVVDGPPLITTQPAGFTETEGTFAQLQVAASGENLSYQWLKGDLELAGKTEATLSFSPLSLDDAGTYRVRIKNNGGLTLSDPALVAVLPGSPPPVFTTSPGSVSVHEGEPFVLTAVATGDGPIRFSWSKGTDVLPDATGNSLTVSAATPGDAGSYTISAQGVGGTTVSPPAVVTVVAPLRLGMPQSDAGLLRLPFNGISGRTYSLESTASLTPPSWTPAGEVVATGTDQFVISESAAGARWYRARAQ